ncbi:enoyl-CoA hydratase-related protein [Marinobacterium rhizophilum]|uniref:enoyl-CoA hydratase-related protein n=1 Tax=Marinobacterium rhizophilum TaxID=420402 RepID=UPI0003691C4B|nr:enoyl-CoA hydratase-related protein [Marinobacterium rhizophilum]
MNTSIRGERRGKIFAISLQRADKKNALTTGMYEVLTELFAEADRDAAVAVIHLTGSGDSFCAGNDLTDFMSAAERGETDSPGRAFLQQLHRQRKPIVAAVNGVAVGIGVTLLLHCDLAYAAAGATFRLPFVDLGLVPEGGSSALLPQMLGHRRAAELLLAGRKFDAETAVVMGIVNEACPADQLQAHSWSMAELLAAKPSQALLEAKAMLKKNPGRPLAAVIDSEIDQFMARLAGEEAQQVLRGLMKPGA